MAFWWDRRDRYNVFCRKSLALRVFGRCESRRLHFLTTLGGAPSHSPPRCALAIRLACGRRRSAPSLNYARWGPFTFPTSLRARHSARLRPQALCSFYARWGPFTFPTSLRARHSARLRPQALYAQWGPSHSPPRCALDIRLACAFTVQSASFSREQERPLADRVANLRLDVGRLVHACHLLPRRNQVPLSRRRDDNHADDCHEEERERGIESVVED